MRRRADVVVERPLAVPLAGGVVLAGDLAVPDEPLGVVVFAHGSGSSRHSPRNRMVAAHLQRRRLATVLVDLLTEDEERIDLRTRHLRFDVELLAGRVHGVAEWVHSETEVGDLPLGYFGASTGAAAALIAAGDHPDAVAAVVSRGGRPDLAAERLPRVRAATLLIVGGHDEVVLDLNRRARAELASPSRLEIVPGATHLFEEPGALEAVAELAAEWLSHHLPSAGAPR